MSNIYQIPLSNISQRFNISLLGINYIFELVWNEQNNSWEISLFDESQLPVITKLPLVCGVNLLCQHKHLLDATLVCFTHGNNDAIPTYDNLGKESYVYFRVAV